eukprot:TRINITY_DN10409_c0_g1_i8.p3 TRINITY_DN10409_c0_g1~~TRINITY_DN10409_c0_g1_i8.p3  ORF type:complete len:113 (+),score=37.17 TRINITY_DN10409_c0_g1_i8:78-416(+)
MCIRDRLQLERKADPRNDEDSPTSAKHPSSLGVHSFGVMNKSELPKKQCKSDASLFSPKEAEYLEKAIMQNTKQYDDQITIMLIGDQGVGKTSLMNSWLGLSIPKVSQHTLG